MIRSLFKLESENKIDASLDSCSFVNIAVATRETYGRSPAFSDRQDGQWRTLSFAQCARYSFSVAQWLIENNLGSRCMILSESRLEWPLAFLGIMTAGAVAVPVDAKSTAQELATFIEHTRPAAILVSPKLNLIAKQAAGLAHWNGPYLQLELEPSAGELCIGELPAPAAGFVPRSRSANETAVIAFTSATSGQPKAVEASVSNLFHQMKSLRQLFDVKQGDVLLSILPLNHLLELSCGFLAAFACGAHVNYLNSVLPHEIKDALKSRGITHMIVVPLLMEMIKKGIERNFVSKLGDRGLMLLQALQTASSITPSQQLRRLVNRFILSELGPNLNTLIVGGATLDQSTLNFFANLGIYAWQGYGLTETSPVAAVNVPGKLKRGSVGLPMPGCEIKVQAARGEKVGEILIKGPCVMNGYHDDPELTGKVIDNDGWFHTGDLGFLCGDGYLHITGRKKNLIVLDGGKKVYPEEVEKILSASTLFQELCVTGVRTPHPSITGRVTEQVCAVIVPHADMREQHAAATLQTMCEQEVNKLCRDLSAYKKPVTVIVHLQDLPKTRTGKVKAALVQQMLFAHS